RAASPYHGSGLADWFARFQDHVNFHGSPEAFVSAYLAGRHRFEARYDAQTGTELAALAIRHGASYVIAGADTDGFDPARSPTSGRALERLHPEGRSAVSRGAPPELAQRH